MSSTVIAYALHATFPGIKIMNNQGLPDVDNLDFNRSLSYGLSGWIRLDQVGSGWIRLDQVGSGWIKLDKVGSSWIRLDQLESTS